MATKKLKDMLKDSANVDYIKISGASGLPPIQLDDTVHDDIPTSIMNVKLPNNGAPLEVNWNHGIAAGVEFPTFGFDVGEYVYAIIQSPHNMKLSSALAQHMHFSVPSDGTGDKFKFQVDVIAAAVNGSWAVPTGSPFVSETTMDADYSGLHKIAGLADIPAANTTVSTLYKLKLTRIAASANEYAGRVYVDFFDGHYNIDDLGSKDEYTK